MNAVIHLTAEDAEVFAEDAESRRPLFASSAASSATSAVKSGAGALTLNNPNSTFSGGVTVSAGTLVIGDSSTPLSGTVTAGPLGTGTLTIANGASIKGANTTVALLLHVPILMSVGH